MPAVNPEEAPQEPIDEPLEPMAERISFSSVPALLTSLLLSGILLIFSLYGWYALGPEVRVRVTWPQAATLAFFVLAMIVIMLSVGYSRLWADENGVTIRNGPVLRKFRVEDIAGLRLRSGDAWAYLLIKDQGGVKRRAVLAIQQLEGAQGKKKLRDLRAWLKAHGATSAGTTLTEE